MRFPSVGMRKMEIQGGPTHYFADAAGNYLGGWSDPDAASIPRGATEVPTAPDDARQIWDGQQWLPVPKP